MPTPILATKLYTPPLRPKVVLRPHLIERLNAGLHRKLTLISAPAGFGKTTLVSEWVSGGKRPFAWLSLDEADNEPTRFLAYLVAALQTILPAMGTGVMEVLQSPQPPPAQSMLTILVNELLTIDTKLTLVLDDYHLIDAPAVDNMLSFLIQHLPPQIHLVIATREDPSLPLARLRARSQLTELRASDLRLTAAEATEFLNKVMGLNLTTAEVNALETRTEGWVAGLQLAALALQGNFASHETSAKQSHPNVTTFIDSFTGSHRFILDYLVEEVLQQQPKSIQTFLLHTSILERLFAPLCEALLESSTASGQEMLEAIEQANLFIIPLDNERRWYRYHHLFADLLRQRLQQSTITGNEIIDLHGRASLWYEENGLEVDAFQHAVAANNIGRAVRLVEGKGMPLLFRGAIFPVLNWLESLPRSVLDANPSLWVIHASAYLFVGQIGGVEQKLRAAEAALQGVPLDEQISDLIGHIASIRATVAVIQHDAETIMSQSHRALAHLHPYNLPVRAATSWTLGVAHKLQGARSAARQAFSEALAASEPIGHFIITIAATNGLGSIQEAETQLHLATKTYKRVLQLVGDVPQPIACEAHLGLARICYEWNELEAAQAHGQKSLELAQLLEYSDRPVASKLFLAHLELAQGELSTADRLVNEAAQAVEQYHFEQRLADVAAAKTLLLMHKGKLAEAAQLATVNKLPLSQARVYLAQGESATTLAALESLEQQAEANGWIDVQLQVMVLQAVAHDLEGNDTQAIGLIGKVLTLTEPEGFIRLFVDVGQPMAALLAKLPKGDETRTAYMQKLLAAFGEQHAEQRPFSTPQPLIEPLSPRELDVLHLIAQGLSNREIGERLFLSLNTIKGHNQRIFGKLGVQRRTEAVARARELKLLV